MNPEPQIGDIWLWLGKTYVLVLGYDDVEAAWIGFNFTNGVTGLWNMETTSYYQHRDWKLIA